MTDLIALNDNSKVWIYHAKTPFSEVDVHVVRDMIRDFVFDWKSHTIPLRAYGNVFHRRFICLFVDESQKDASGCSIDASRRFIQELETKFNVSLLERMHCSYIKDEEVYDVIALDDIQKLYDENEIDENTLFFDNLVRTKNEFLTSWLKPLYNSWQSKFVKFQ